MSRKSGDFFHEDYVINLRRYFHVYPELSGREANTSMKIRQELEKLGIECEEAGEFGLIGTLNGKGHGKTIALRADIDALPLQESHRNLRREKPAVSSVENVCHACGHDGHSAMLLGAAKALSEIRDRFYGTVLFCFEQGEENGSGVAPMMEKLEARKVDGVWGIHLYSGLPSGMVSVDKGSRMSGASLFAVNVIGRGGHGSTPNLAIDPINCTVHMLSNLSSILTRELDPADTAVLTVGKLHAGQVANVIAESANFEGTMRFFDLGVGKKMIDSFKRIVESTAAAHKCEVEIKVSKPGYPVINDEALSEMARESVRKAIGQEFLTGCKPWMASESIGRYLQRYPGVFAFLGIANEELGTGADHHNPSFDIDESHLKSGVDISVQFALDFLSQ